MAIAYVGSGTTVSGSGASPTLAPVAPASGADRRNFLVVTWKSTTIPTPTVTSATGVWIPLGQSNNTPDVASGADVGSCSVAVWYADGTAPTTNSVAFTGTVGCAQANISNFSKASSESWSYQYSVGADNSNGANYTATTLTNFLGTANDLLVGFTSTNSDLGTYSADAITATGLTLGATTVRTSSRTAVADDNSLLIHTTPVTSGTQSDPAVLSLTNASNTMGASLIVRLRVITTPAITVAPVDEFAQTAGYQISVSGLTAYEEFQITATAAGLPDRDMRGGHRQDVDGDTFVGEDYEFSFGYTGSLVSPVITYTLHAYTEDVEVGTISADTVQSPLDEWEDNLTSNGFTTGEGPQCYLVVPLQPALNTPVCMLEFPEYSRKGRILSQSDVLNREMPVVATDVMSGRTATFTLIVPHDHFPGSQYVPNSVNEFTEVFELGFVLMLRFLSPAVVGFEDFYFIVDSISVKRLNRVVNQLSSEMPVISIEVGFIEVESPPSIETVSAVDWQYVNDNNSSWTDVLNSNDTWLDVLQNG